jgi:UDP-N-acetylmuramate--alanine ligase
MSAIASVLAAMGHTVTGSDLKASAVTDRLAGQGVAVTIGHRAETVRAAAPDVVTASPAVSPGNPELAAARELGAEVVSRGEVLAAVAATRRTLAVAGTHGKTTTSSMLALVLVEAGLRPGFLIGADVNEIGTNADWGAGELLVLEADESYGTFATLRPALSLLTNVEPDHLDHYGTAQALEEAFARFLAAGEEGAVVWADDPAAARLGRTAVAVAVGTGPGADYRVGDLRPGRSQVAFALHGPEGDPLDLAVPVPGAHNAANAAVAAVAALRVGVAPADVARGLARFAGVPRRFEFRGNAGGVTYVDDYAHLPSEVRATLAAARDGGWDRVVAVFQPHRYTRTAALAPDFATAFDQADEVVVTDIYGAGERPVPGVSGHLVAEAVSARRPVHYAPGWEELRATVAGLLRPGDLCLTLGAGDLTALPDELLGAR